MTVKYKNDNKDISYTEEELKSFSKSKLKQINRELQSNIELVSSRRADYLNNNNDGKNSKEYFSKMANYKRVIATLKNQIMFINGLISELDEDDLKKREHWLWCFYMNVKNSTRKGKFNKYIKVTDEFAKYHVEIGE